MKQWPVKSPAEVADFRWLPDVDAGDTLASLTLTLVSGDVVVDRQEPDATGVTVWLSGGTDGANLFHGLVTTTAGRTFDEYISLTVSDGGVPEDPNREFSYVRWAARYPELSNTVGEPAADVLADEAQALWNFTLMVEPARRRVLLNMAVAHLAALGGAGTAGGYGAPTGMVGRVSKATEGSVSVESDIGTVSGSAAWWAQTTYGYAFWQATSFLRRFRYAPGPTPVFERFGANRRWLR